MILARDEVIIFETRIKTSLIVLISIIGLFTVLFIVGFFLLFGAFFYSRKRFYVTNKRVVVESLFSTTEMPLSKIESVSVSFGDNVTITGTGGNKQLLQGIKNSSEFAHAISSQI